MLPAGSRFDAAEKAQGAAPLGWRLAMRLCNLLIGITAAGLALLLAYEYNLHSYF